MTIKEFWTKENLENIKSRIAYFCSLLNLREDVEKHSFDLIDKVFEKNIYSPTKNQKSFDGIVAGVVYISAICCGDRRVQREIAEVVGISSVTLYKRYKEIAENTDIEIIL